MSADTSQEHTARPPAVGARVVVGFDAGPSAQRAFDFGIGAAARSGGSVVCVYVERLPSWLAGAGFTAIGPDVAFAEAEVRRSLRAVVEDEVREARHSVDVPIELVIVRASRPEDGIREVAAEVAADQVIVGGSPPTRLRRRSNVGRALQQRSRWPVTIVP